MDEYNTNPLDSELRPEWVEKVFAETKGSDALVEFLYETMGQDMIRYFNASTDAERNQIKGAFSRTKYLRSKLLGADDPTRTAPKEARVARKQNGTLQKT